MKTKLTSAFLVALVALTACRFSYVHLSGNALNSTASQVQQGRMDSDTRMIDVDHSMGPIKIRAVHQPPYRWTWYLEARAESDAAAQRGLSLVRLHVKTNGSSLQFTLELPRPYKYLQFHSELEISTPKAVAVRAVNEFGSIEIADVDGPVEARSQSDAVTVCHVRQAVCAETSFASLRVADTGPATLKNESGEIVAERIHGALRANTRFGRISATEIDGAMEALDESGGIDADHVEGNATLETSFAALTLKNGKGNADLKNQSGSILARSVAGALVASTSFGAMDLEGGGESFVCHDQSGGISLHATSPRLAQVDVQTSFSAIDLQLPAGAKPAIHAHTTFGDVVSDFPILVAAEAASAQVNLENESGPIRIRRATD